MARAAQTPDAVRNALRFAVEQAAELKKMNAVDHVPRLKRFLEPYLKGRDETLRALGRCLLDIREADPTPWVEATVKNARPEPLPEDARRRLALPFRLFHAAALGERVDLRYLVSTSFPGDAMHIKMGGFIDHVVLPWIAALEKFAEDATARLPESGLVDITAIAEEVWAG